MSGGRHHVVRRVLRVALFAGLALAASPSPGFAQTHEFFDALLPVYRLVAGTYGDEGPRLTASVETLASARAREDAALAQSQEQLRAGLRDATPLAALQTHTLLASMYLEHAQFMDAIREFDQDLLIDPNRAAFHRFKGLIYQALGMRMEAADALRAAWLRDPSDPQNAYHLLVYRSTGTTAAERAKAMQTLAVLEGSLRRERPKADVPFLSVRPLNDDAGGAMAFAPAAYADAFAQLINGRVEAGMAGLRTAVARDPLVADTALRSEPTLRGITALRSGNVGEAITALQTALAAAPRSSEVNRILATAEIVNGDLTSALVHLRDAVRLDPKNERAWLALATTLDDIGDWDTAAETLRTAIKALPDSGELRWQLVVVAGKRQRTDATDAELIATVDHLTLLVGTSELYTRVATLAQAHLDYDRAVALLQQAVVLTPNKASAHRLLGRAYLDQGREEEAFAELTIALWLQPADVETLAAIGRLHLTAGRYPEAVEALTRANALDPTDAQTLQALGEAFIRSGNAEAGRQRIENAARQRERAVEAQRRARTAGMLSLQAELAMAEHNPADAIDLWRNAAALESRDVSIRVRLADALIAANLTYTKDQITWNAASAARATKPCANPANGVGCFTSTIQPTTVVVPLLLNNEMYGERVTYTDMKFAKNIRFSGKRAQIGVDLYNIFNSDAITSYNGTYTVGASNTWLQPISLISPRYMRFQVQFDF